MRLAFSGEARYADCTEGYKLYMKRARKECLVNDATYKKVLKAYCRRLSERLKQNGMVDLPCGLGMVSTTIHTRRPMYRDGKFDGYGMMDWKTGARDGKLKVFGIAFLPKHGKGSLRCYGFVANRKLFQAMKEKYNGDDCQWVPIEFNNEMI